MDTRSDDEHWMIWFGAAEPDVWWGDDGIDALIWPKPYRKPDVEPPEEASEHGGGE